MANNNLNRSETPTSVPPEIVPPYCRGALKPTKEILSAYIKTYVYIWLVNGFSFWMYPQQIVNNMLCGVVWAEENWEPACFSINLIKSIY